MAEIYIRADKKTRVVTFVHKRPFDPVHGLGETRENLLKTGFFVDEYPEPETTIGKRAIAYYDHEREKVYYEYEVVPFTEKKRLDIMEAALNDLLLSNTVPAASATISLFSVPDGLTVEDGEITMMNGLAKYLASQIYQMKLDKEKIINSYPELAETIEKYLDEYQTIPIVQSED